MQTRAWLRLWWIEHVVALNAVILMSVVIGVVLSYQQIPNISMLYLLVILAIAVSLGRWPAVLASVAAFLIFDWFFIEPLHALTIAEPSEWIALILFLITAIITGQLAAAQRQQAQQARQREREAVVLHDVARLMGEPELSPALNVVAERLLAELQLSAVLAEIADNPYVSARSTAGEPEALRTMQASLPKRSRLLGAGAMPTASSRGAPGRWVRVMPPHPPGQISDAGDRLHVVPVKAGDRRVGVLVLMRKPGALPFTNVEDRLLSTVAAQLGVVVQRVRSQREATEAEIIRRSDELKTALLNAVSHDLRTPLASIIASAGSLGGDDFPLAVGERKELAHGIEEEALRLNQIVGNLLDLSRIEGGSLRPEKDWYDFAALVDDVLGRLGPLLAQHSASVDVPSDLPPVHLDYVEIDQVLSNLIENAVKYSPPGEPIDLSVRREDDYLRVEVADHGPGVPPAALPKLFEPFYRVDRQGPRPKGTGLGLAVAKGLVEAHGGRIWAGNRPGGGATFVFTLPMAASTGEPTFRRSGER